MKRLLKLVFAAACMLGLFLAFGVNAEYEYKCPRCKTLNSAHNITHSSDIVCLDEVTCSYLCPQCTAAQRGIAYSYDHSFPANGHRFGDWQLGVAPTQTTEGSKYKECSICRFKNYQTIGWMRMEAQLYPEGDENCENSYRVGEEVTFVLKIYNAGECPLYLSLDGGLTYAGLARRGTDTQIFTVTLTPEMCADGIYTESHVVTAKFDLDLPSYYETAQVSCTVSVPFERSVEINFSKKEPALISCYEEAELGVNVTNNSTYEITNVQLHFTGDPVDPAITKLDVPDIAPGQSRARFWQQIRYPDAEFPYYVDVYATYEYKGMHCRTKTIRAMFGKADTGYLSVDEIRTIQLTDDFKPGDTIPVTVLVSAHDTAAVSDMTLAFRRSDSGEFTYLTNGKKVGDMTEFTFDVTLSDYDINRSMVYIGVQATARCEYMGYECAVFSPYRAKSVMLNFDADGKNPAVTGWMLLSCAKLRDLVEGEELLINVTVRNMSFFEDLLVEDLYYTGQQKPLRVDETLGRFGDGHYTIVYKVTAEDVKRGFAHIIVHCNALSRGEDRYQFSAQLDGICAPEPAGTDAKVTAVCMPYGNKKLAAGDTLTFSVMIQNTGAGPIDAYRVLLLSETVPGKAVCTSTGGHLDRLEKQLIVDDATGQLSMTYTVTDKDIENGRVRLLFNLELFIDGEKVVSRTEHVFTLGGLFRNRDNRDSAPLYTFISDLGIEVIDDFYLVSGTVGTPVDYCVNGIALTVTDALGNVRAYVPDIVFRMGKESLGEGDSVDFILALERDDTQEFVIDLDISSELYDTLLNGSYTVSPLLPDSELTELTVSAYAIKEVDHVREGDTVLFAVTAINSGSRALTAPSVFVRDPGSDEGFTDGQTPCSVLLPGQSITRIYTAKAASFDTEKGEVARTFSATASCADDTVTANAVTASLPYEAYAVQNICVPFLTAVAGNTDSVPVSYPVTFSWTVTNLGAGGEIDLKGVSLRAVDPATGKLYASDSADFDRTLAEGESVKGVLLITAPAEAAGKTMAVELIACCDDGINFIDTNVCSFAISVE